jgi:hypothetical protein
MSKTETSVQKDEEVVAVVVGEDSIKWVNLAGGCAVHGMHLVCDKLAGIVSEIMKKDVYKDNFGVRCIEFKNNGFPTGKVGMAYIDGGAIAINLEEIWSSCLSVLEEGKVKLGMTGVIWDELITTLLHEIHHIDACRDSDYRTMAKDDPSGADDDAEAWANETLSDLCKVFDIEPVALADMNFFKVKLMELMTSDLKNEDWVVRTRVLLEDGIMYHDEDNDITIKTFREYLRGIEDPDEKDDNWEQGVSVIDLIFSMDDGTVMKTVEVLPEPVVVEVSTEEQIKEVFTAPGAIGAETPIAASPAQALFAPAPMTDTDDDTAVAAEDVVDMVALPANIVAEQEQIAAAAAAVPEVAAPATSYEPNGLCLTNVVVSWITTRASLIQEQYWNLFRLLI